VEVKDQGESYLVVLSGLAKREHKKATSTDNEMLYLLILMAKVQLTKLNTPPILE